ncbi:MAG: hypothetical protein KDA90_07310, partial [Planctomycetaceae bacterium]|nr:hypothetical protein [Planctomycetaceae bacterium]
VVMSTRGLVTSRWYFQRNPPALVGFDTTLSDDVPPCEIRFGETLQANSLTMPKNWQLRYLDQDLGTFVLQNMSLEAGETK